MMMIFFLGNEIRVCVCERQVDNRSIKAINWRLISHNSWLNFPLLFHETASCACFCSIDEWRHATKHRLMFDARARLVNSMINQNENETREEVDLMCTYIRKYIVNLLNEQW